MSILEIYSWADLEKMSDKELDSLDSKMDIAYKDERTMGKAIRIIKETRVDPEAKARIDEIKKENPGIEHTTFKPRQHDPGHPRYY